MLTADVNIILDITLCNNGQKQIKIKMNTMQAMTNGHTQISLHFFSSTLK